MVHISKRKLWHDYISNNLLLSLTSEGDVKDSEHFRYAEETELALQAGKLSADITKEHGKLSQADLVIFQVQLGVGQG